MKRFLMTLAAVLCCTMITTVFTACSDDENEPRTYTYNISLEIGSYVWTDDDKMDVSQWYNAIIGAYMTEIGVKTETFTLKGTRAECDQKVLEACQKAEEKVATISGGTGIVTVKNETTSKTIYTYNVKSHPTTL